MSHLEENRIWSLLQKKGFISGITNSFLWSFSDVYDNQRIL